MKTSCYKIILPKSHLHRPFKFQLSSFTFLSTLCFLISVFCPPSWAGGSWIVDGQAVQALEVQTTNADPNALYTDGTRSMQAPLAFDPSVSGLFRAYTPWDGMYDFFLFDADLEAVKLSNGDVTFYPTWDLYISGTTIGDDSGGGGRVDIGEMTLKGGSWMLDAVGPYDESIITRVFADNRYVQDQNLTDTILIETPGFGNDLKFHSSDSDMKFDVGSGTGVMEIWTDRMSVEGDVSITHELSTASTAPDPEWEFPGHYVGNRDYNDVRYIQRTEGITINHTIQAGDVLQIQSGIITAINP